MYLKGPLLIYFVGDYLKQQKINVREILMNTIEKRREGKHENILIRNSLSVIN